MTTVHALAAEQLRTAVQHLNNTAEAAAKLGLEVNYDFEKKAPGDGESGGVRLVAKARILMPL